MKKLLLTAGVLMCMLLTACKGNQNETTDETQESAEAGQVTLYEDQGIQVMLKASISVDYYGKSYVFQAINDNDQNRQVYISDIVINDAFVIGEECNFYLDPYEESAVIAEEIAAALLMEDIEEITSVSCHIEIQDENYEVIEELDANPEMVQNLVPAVIYDPFLDAKADEQVLVDDENVKVTLKGWGKSPESGYVRATVYFENKSEDEIPVMISAMSLNGIFLECHDRVNFLKPGENCYSVGSILESEAEDEGIESITDVAVLLMTDESQNTGMVNYDGGEWYQLALSEQGDTAAEFETGEILYETDDIEISLVSQDVSEWSFGGGHYEWKLAVVNNSDENIEVAVTNLLLDGVSEAEWVGDDYDRSFYVSNHEVGAHSNRYVFLNVSYEEKIERPELRFQFQIRSMAGGAVIDTGKEEITIAPDAE